MKKSTHTPSWLKSKVEYFVFTIVLLIILNLYFYKLYRNTFLPIKNINREAMTRQWVETLTWSPKDPSSYRNTRRFWMCVVIERSCASEALLDMFPNTKGASRATAVARLQKYIYAQRILLDYLVLTINWRLKIVILSDTYLIELH